MIHNGLHLNLLGSSKRQHTTKTLCTKTKHKRATEKANQRNLHETLMYIIPAVVVIMSVYYQKYQHCSYPISINEWAPILPLSPLYAPQPARFLMNPTPMLLSQICPYVPSIIVPPVIPSPVIIPNDISPFSYYESLSTDTESLPGSLYGSDNGVLKEEDTIEYYLSLPKDLFPSAKMLVMDPNEMIEEFCKLPNIADHEDWIMDLEFGVPKHPTSRHIATYNVKFNSIHCKNTPDAIHPGFEGCNEGLKSVLLFYYDCIVSAWYKGYVFLNSDISVDNFQSWLLLPMQMFGMCWP